MAANYDWAVLEPFIVSLRRSGYMGDCVLIFAEDPSPGFAAKLNQYRVEPLVRDLQGEHPILARFRIIPEFLFQEAYSEYAPAIGTRDTGYVLAVDTRDVVFQSNPFKWIEEKGIGEETVLVVSEGTRFSNNDGNKRNLIEAFGPDKYGNMKDHWVCNAGVIGGDPISIHDLFLQIYALCQEDLRRQNREPIDMLPDQTALNLLIRLDACWNLKTKICTVRDEFVFGNHHYPLEFPIPSLRDGLLYLDDSITPVPIFHQYDQNQVFRDTVLTRWKE
jgi:hypothetical protein